MSSQDKKHRADINPKRKCRKTRIFGRVPYKKYHKGLRIETVFKHVTAILTKTGLQFQHDFFIAAAGNTINVMAKDSSDKRYKLLGSVVDGYPIRIKTWVSLVDTLKSMGISYGSSS